MAFRRTWRSRFVSGVRKSLENGAQHADFLGGQLIEGALSDAPKVMGQARRRLAAPSVVTVARVARPSTELGRRSTRWSRSISAMTR
jgi:hypothetical protein